MTISLKSDASGNSGSIQLAGVDRLTLNTDGSLVAGANPATGLRSMTLATMQKFADEFGASLSANGYQKLPSGLIIQWGNVSGSFTSGTYSGPTFPITFPNECFLVHMQVGVGSPLNGGGTANLLSKTTATFSFYYYDIDTYMQNYTWFAIGR